MPVTTWDLPMLTILQVMMTIVRIVCLHSRWVIVLHFDNIAKSAFRRVFYLSPNADFLFDAVSLSS